MKLSGKNFQPWAEFDLEFEGLAVLTGSSNKGKSSIYRALKALLRNELDIEYIRNPKTNPMELTLEFVGPDGQPHKIFATRGKKGKVVYTVDGEDFSSLNEDVPKPEKNPNLFAAFGEIKVGEFSFDPIFGDQNTPQFLIDRLAYKPTAVNTIIGAFGGTEKLEIGKKEANLRITQKNGEAKLHATEVREAEERKLKLEKVAIAGKAASDSLTALEQEARLLELRAAWTEEARTHRVRLIRLRRVEKALVLPDLTETGQLDSKILYASVAASAAASLARRKDRLERINTVLSLWPDTVRAWKVCRAAEDATAALQRKETLSPEALSKTTEQIEAGLATAIRQFHSIKHIEQVLAHRERLATKKDQRAQLEQDLAAAEIEAKRGACPKCGKSLEHVCNG